MMHNDLLRPRTLDGKLRRFTVLTVGLALSLALIGIVLLQILTARESLLRELEILADVLGTNGAASLVFFQADAAERILASSQVHPDILRIDFLTPDGAVFADYQPAVQSPDFPSIDSMQHAWTTDALFLRRDVIYDGEYIGEIRLIAGLERIRQRLFQSVILACFILIICGLFAWKIGSRKIRGVTRPVLELAKAAENVAVTHDYGVRAVKHADDEIGRLTDQFNHMLSQIAERQSLERDNEELTRTKEELEAKNAELERFTYTVSHDLKSPLFTIQGFIGLLERDVAKGKIERLDKNIEHIRGAADKMQQLLNDLLQLSRIGRVLNPMEEIDLGSLVRSTCELLAGEIDDRGADIRIADAMPPVYGDRQRLQEVFQNLIGNALRYMGEAEEPWIEITAQEEQDGEKILCKVRDNGIGIAPRYHEKIFGLFEVLDAEGPGTGIGLALVRRIIEFHEGKIGVESDLGEGTTFHFTLPSRRPIV